MIDATNGPAVIARMLAAKRSTRDAPNCIVICIADESPATWLRSNAKPGD